MCAYSVFNTFPVYPLSAKPLILLAFCRYRYHTSLFDRPGFLAMMEAVEAGRVEAIVIKDMSRPGRDYLKAGQVMEILRQRGVRLIAINDGVDSLKGDDDFTPFRNIMNEFYARDTSRKIRSVFKSKGMSGKHLTGTVIYGYLWDEKREHWLVEGGSRRGGTPHLFPDDGGLRPLSNFQAAVRGKG